MTFLPFLLLSRSSVSPPSLLKKYRKILYILVFFFLFFFFWKRNDSCAGTRMMRREKGEEGTDGFISLPPEKKWSIQGPPRLFVLQEIKYEAIKLPVNREPRRRRRRRPLLFFCASNLGASRKGQIMASL